MTATQARDWSAHADTAQDSLTRFFGSDRRGFFDTYPHELYARGPLNYWWLAHAVEARLDAYERTGERQWLDAASHTLEAIRRRNRGSLFNDYFDDMLWCAIATLRLSERSGLDRYRKDAVAFWAHIDSLGRNDTFGRSVAWRTTQLDYKNAPANAPFAVFSARMAKSFPADTRFRAAAVDTFAWLTDTLVDPHSHLVADGINRLGDGGIDSGWVFSYNQGVYVGAAVELFHLTGDGAYLSAARQTAEATIAATAHDGVFRVEGDGGDSGLFKGIFYRYAELLCEADPGTGTSEVSVFIRSSTDALLRHASWRRRESGEVCLLASDDWSARAPFPTRRARTTLATELSAVMAVEARARLERSAGERLSS